MTVPRAEHRLVDLMTIKQVARLWRVVPLTVMNWRRRGCPTVVIPGDKRDAIRFKLTGVIRWHQALGHRVPPGVMGQLNNASRPNQPRPRL